MKKIFLLLISSAMIFASCSNWLDVRPKAEIKSNVMFESEQGFKDAMVGCYILMSNPTIYGRELTCTFLDALAQQYEFNGDNTSLYVAAAKYEYQRANVETTINRVWLDLYNVIANVNNIIENIDARKDVMSPMAYHVIKGEAYGLRAFLHFELLRMFSYGNLANRTDKLDEIAIPYRVTYDKNITPRLTLREVLSKINSDLGVSISNLKAYDPISKVTERPNDYFTDTEDLFMKTRSYHFNYHSALATKMRILMWQGGNEDEVIEISNYLIETATIPWISDANINSVSKAEKDLTFSTEQLFGVETFDRFELTVKPYFKITITTDYTVNMKAVYVSNTKAEKLYEIKENIGVSDIRYNNWFNAGQKMEVIKYWEFLDAQENRGKFVDAQPIIRTPEIYYMAAECKAKKGDHLGAIKLINTVRNNRGITAGKNLPNNLSKEEISKEIEKEWRKEFLGEGQLFYFYKRLGYTEIENSVKGGSDEIYLLPIPESER